MRLAPSIAAVLLGTACLFANPIATVAAQSTQRDWSSIEYRKDDYADEATWRRALARAYFDAPVIDACLSMLRNEYVKQTVPETLIEETRTLLDDFVRNRGKALLRDEAVRRLMNGSPSERHRAQLILGRYPEIPADVVRRASVSPRLEHRVWAASCNTGRLDRATASDATLYRRGPTAPTLGRDPIADVADAIRAALRIDPDVLSKAKPAYREAYRTTFEPALTDLSRHFPANRWTHVDFDGDGMAELFIVGGVPDGWSRYGRVATMILRWSRPQGRWTIAYLRTWDDDDRFTGAADLVVADFDGDGRAEIAEHVSIVAGWCWESVFYHDEETLACPPRIHGRSAHVARLPNDPRPVIVARSAHNPTGGGKASYLVTALASELCVVRRDGPRAESATVLVRGNGW